MRRKQTAAVCWIALSLLASSAYAQRGGEPSREKPDKLDTYRLEEVRREAEKQKLEAARQTYQIHLARDQQAALVENLKGGRAPEYRLSKGGHVSAWTQNIGKYELSREGFQAWLDALSQAPIATANMQLWSFVDNGPTEDAIKKRFFGLNYVLTSRQRSPTIRDLAMKTSGKVVILLGHIEGGLFLWKDPTGLNTKEHQGAREMVSIRSLEKTLREAGSLPLFVGCNSALFARYGTGSVGLVNSYDVVGRLAKAFRSQNLADLLSSLSSPEARMQLAPPDIADLSDMLRLNVATGSGSATIYISKSFFPPAWCSGQSVQCAPAYQWGFCRSPNDTGLNAVSNICGK